MLTYRLERFLACVFALSLAIGMYRSRCPSDNAHCVVVRFILESLALHAAHVIHTVSNKLSDRERLLRSLVLSRGAKVQAHQT